LRQGAAPAASDRRGDDRARGRRHARLKENGPVRFEQTFTVRRPPEDVFEWDHVVEFTEFEPGRAFGGSGTRVHFEADMKAPPGLGTLFKWIAARQFRGYHENLRRELERP
jgi:hypothetical protein